MSEENAVPPSPEEHRRTLAQLRTVAPIAVFVLLAVAWLLMEFGGPWGEQVLGYVIAAIFAAWLITWPARRWKAWKKGRRPRPS